VAALLPKVVATAPAAFVSVYVEVDDLQATPDELEKLGGRTILPPSEVPCGPKLAIFTDPVAMSQDSR
jgi:predicted enzyme related to lactoylglutathione lyase